MAALVLVPTFPPADPLAVVRVASGRGAVHFASRAQIERCEPRLVTVCTTRIASATITDRPVSCSFCAAPHVVSMYAPRDVTDAVMADALDYEARVTAVAAGFAPNTGMGAAFLSGYKAHHAIGCGGRGVVRLDADDVEALESLADRVHDGGCICSAHERVRAVIARAKGIA